MMIRLLRLGGPSLILTENVDRPAVGRLVAACVALAGEHRLLYIGIGLLFWLALAAEGALLWIRLFPKWSFAWWAVAIAVLAPIVTIVQFTTVTTVFPCVAPVVLVLAALLILLSRSDDGVSLVARVSAALLAASAAVLSEYALATAAAAVTLLLLLRRWRGTLTLGAGVSLGYLVFRAISDVSLRGTTDPDVQLEAILRKPWSAPFRIVGAAWDCMAGSWGRAVSDLQIEWSSKSTLLAAGVALAVAICVAALRGTRCSVDPLDPVSGNLLPLIAAVVAGLVPTFVIWRFPLIRTYETRYFLPVLVFASCATIAGFLHLSRPQYAPMVLFAFLFLSMDRLVLRAIEEKRLQSELEQFGERMRPFVGQEKGLVVLVSPDRPGISPEETMAKATYPWGFPQAGRLWIVSPSGAQSRFGPRSGCRNAESLQLQPRDIRWPRAEEPIRVVLYDAAHVGGPDPEPYFRGCPAR